MSKRPIPLRQDCIHQPTASEPCPAGSLRQQLDMCETGNLRGEEILYSHGIPSRDHEVHRELDPELMESNFHVDLSEDNREGDEETGDEHTAGLQGDEQQELQYDTEFGESDAGLPGELTNKNAHCNPLAPGHHY
ncbi:MAG: hypothetical protein HY074_12700 [Deltaproteobacteria bacterium]|nr:hypothetical protein [Deltaproteobacteria bacterium]